MFKFLHAADIHLDSALRGLDQYDGAPVEEIRGASRRALENLVATALQQDVAFVIIAGDIYDGDWLDFNTGLFFHKQMSRLQEAGIPVVLVRGNHDAANKMTRTLNLPKNVRHLATKRPESVEGRDIGFGLEKLDVVFHGQGFATPAVADNVVLDYPATRRGLFNIGVLHTSLQLEGGEHARYAPCSASDLLAKQYDYWALGHVHKRCHVHDDPPIVFPGNIQGRHIRETDAKGCVLVTVDSAGRAAVEFQPLDVFRWYELPVALADVPRGDAALEQIELSLRQLLVEQSDLPLAVRVVVTGACEAHRELAGAPTTWTNQIRATAAEISNGAVWIEKVKLQTTLPTARDADLDDGPVQEISRCCAELRQQAELLPALVKDALDDLNRKLPDEMKTGPDSLRLDDPAYLRAMLDEVEPLLVARLLTGEVAP